MSLVSTQIQSNPFLFYSIQIKPTPHVLSLHPLRQLNSSISPLTFKRCPICTCLPFNSMTCSMLLNYHPTQHLSSTNSTNRPMSLNHHSTQQSPQFNRWNSDAPQSLPKSTIYFNSTHQIARHYLIYARFANFPSINLSIRPIRHPNLYPFRPNC